MVLQGVKIVKKRDISLRKICEIAQEEFFEANGYYPTNQEAVKLAEEAKAEVLKRSVKCDKKSEVIHDKDS